MKHKCIFLDKDGTLIYDVPYNVNTDKIRFYNDIFAPLLRLSAAKFKLIIISNQSGIARGYFNEVALETAMQFIVEKLLLFGISIDAYYYCPHDELKSGPGCNCRKPSPQLLLQAAHDYNIDLSQSWMVGDILTDVAAGNAAGCKTILLDRNGKEQLLPKTKEPLYCPDSIHLDFYDILKSIKI